MLSRKQYREMLDDYEQARALVEDAASMVEDQSISVGAAGEACRRKSVTTISKINELCTLLQWWSHFFESNAEVSE